MKNKPGAGGALAATALKAMPADGYSLAAVLSTTVSFDPHASNIAYGVDDFEYIAAFGIFPEAIVALPEKNWNSFADVIEAARSSETGLTYASTTSLDKVIMKSIAARESIILKPVPTKGAAEAVAQTLGGHVDFAYSSGTYYAQAQAGKLSVLAGLGTDPVPGFEDAPTLESLGYGPTSVNMVVYMVPAGIPEDAKAKLVEAFQAAAQSKAVLDLLATLNMGSVTLTGDDIDKQIHAQSNAFEKAVKN